MSDKTSQRTEEEMLDQTFVGYDEEMTVQTEDSAKDNSSAPAAAPDKKNNQNLLVYGAMGLAAVGFLGYKFLGGDSAPQQQVQEPIQATQQAPQQVQSGIVAATTEPVPVPTQPQVVVPTPVPVTPEQSATVTPTPTVETNIDPVAQYTGNTTSASLPKVEEVKPEVKVEVQPVQQVQPVQPVQAEVQTVNVERVAAVTASNAEASSSNERLLAQFQDMLDKKYDPKFDKIEKSLDEQKQVNKSIEERLARLEAGKSTKVAVASSSDSSATSEVKPVKKIVRKPVVIKRKVEKKVQHSNTKSEESEVLIDRSSVKSKPEIQKIAPVYPKLEIHSVYSGRIWTKNADGTLSTFAVGDKLPSGEVIKKIDEEKEKVVTDRRVISQ